MLGVGLSDLFLLVVNDYDDGELLFEMLIVMVYVVWGSKSFWGVNII